RRERGEVFVIGDGESVPGADHVDPAGRHLRLEAEGRFMKPLHGLSLDDRGTENAGLHQAAEGIDQSPGRDASVMHAETEYQLALGFDGRQIDRSEGQLTTIAFADGE